MANQIHIVPHAIALIIILFIPPKSIFDTLQVYHTFITHSDIGTG